jgi:hypothetical protein
MGNLLARRRRCWMYIKAHPGVAGADIPKPAKYALRSLEQDGLIQWDDPRGPDPMRPDSDGGWYVTAAGFWHFYREDA